MLTEIHNGWALRKFLKQETLVLLFAAEWSYASKVLYPWIEEFCLKESIPLGLVNIHGKGLQTSLVEFDIVVIPTIIHQKGETINRIPGLLNKKDLYKKLGY